MLDAEALAIISLIDSSGNNVTLVDDGNGEA